MKRDLLKSVVVVALVLTATLVLALKPAPLEAAGARVWVLYDGAMNMLGAEETTRRTALTYCDTDYSGVYGSGHVVYVLNADTGHNICR